MSTGVAITWLKLNSHHRPTWHMLTEALCTQSLVVWLIHFVWWFSIDLLVSCIFCFSVSISFCLSGPSGPKEDGDSDSLSGTGWFGWERWALVTWRPANVCEWDRFESRQLGSCCSCPKKHQLWHRAHRCSQTLTGKYLLIFFILI